MEKSVKIEFKGHSLICNGYYDLGEPPVWNAQFEIEEVLYKCENKTRSANIVSLLADLDQLTEITQICLELIKND